jgi:hypothetical protein
LAVFNIPITWFLHEKSCYSAVGRLKGLPGLSCCPLSKAYLTLALPWLVIQGVPNEMTIMICLYFNKNSILWGFFLSIM